MVSKSVVAALLLGWLAIAQASPSSRFHTYVTVTIDGDLAIQPAIASASGLTAHFAVPGGLYAELTSRDVDASRFEVLLNLYEVEGGPLIGSTTFAVDRSSYCAHFEFPLKDTRQLGLQLRGQRFKWPDQGEEAMDVLSQHRAGACQRDGGS